MELSKRANDRKQLLWSRNAEKQEEVLTVLAEDGSSVEVVQDGPVYLKWALHLFPRHELTNLPSQLHKFLKKNKKQNKV